MKNPRGHRYAYRTYGRGPRHMPGPSTVAGQETLFEESYSKRSEYAPRASAMSACAQKRWYVKLGAAPPFK